MAIGTTIDGLNVVTSLTANDEVPLWDAEATGEPTKKITAQNLANSVKGLMPFDTTPTTGSTNLVTSGDIATAIAQSTAVEEYSTTLSTSKYGSFYYGGISADTRNIIAATVIGSTNNMFATVQIIDNQQNGNIRVYGDSSGGTVYVRILRKAV